ncbi:unnamed protein product [Brachionus calyciflorus]|uniref:Uncharacterized protein n=1 Tax=Brachionus calyciflorus TaxID=104777 RepID=A0A813T7S8_9BILA|nr:unnamed protein product [Brachionus calyciflorus]
MVVKWSDQDTNKYDDCIEKVIHQASTKMDDSKLEFLKGYLYNSPTHKGIVCWRALAECHNLENVKHILGAVDFESNQIPSANYPKYQESIKNYSSNPSRVKCEYTIKPKSIYEGCYNGHDERTTLEIRNILCKIYTDLISLEKKTARSPIKPSNQFEAKLLDEYRRISSEIKSNSSSSDEELNFKNLEKINYSDKVSSNEKLEKQSLNKPDDELISNCNLSETESSKTSSDYIYVKTQKPEVKKVIPPRRNRNRLHKYLDEEKSSSSDYEIKKKKNRVKNEQFAPNKNNNILRNSDDKSAFKSVKINDTQKKVDNVVKTDEDYISEFEKVPPRNSKMFSSEQKSKFDEIYNDLNSSASNILKNNDNNNISFKSIKQNDTIKEEPKQENKISYQRTNSPVQVKDHVISLYQVQAAPKTQNGPSENLNGKDTAFRSNTVKNKPSQSKFLDKISQKFGRKSKSLRQK